MRQRKIHVDNAPDLVFQGEILADEMSDKDHGRWTEITLYKTLRGLYVCRRAQLTLWVKEQDRHTARTVDDHAAVVDYFGYSDLAKRLYDHAGITAYEINPDAEAGKG